MSDLKSDIQRAKQALPLPELLKHYGLGDRAKPSTKTPLRQSDNPHAWGIFQKANGDWNWKDHVTGEHGDEIDFIAAYENRSPEDALVKFLELAGIRRGASAPAPAPSRPIPRKIEGPKVQAPAPAPAPGPAFDWQKCVDDLTEDKQEKLCAWRGYSPGIMSTLHSLKLIGSYKDNVAFPVHHGGKVVGCHYRVDNGEWRFEPKGTKVAPLIPGDPATAQHIYAFESQWDGIAVADCLNFHEDGIPHTALIMTRGATNGKLLLDVPMSHEAKIFAFPQNDPEEKRSKKTGLTPSDVWLASVKESVNGNPFKQVNIPAPFKDANDWIRAGLAELTLHEFIAKAAEAKEKKSKLPDSKDSNEIMGQNLPAKPPELIQGILHKGSKLIIGGNSKGKKTYSLINMAVAVATGTKWWGHQCQKGKVAYINFEIQEAFFGQRLEDICAAMKVRPEPGMLRVWTLRGYVTGIEDMIADMLEELMNQDYALIIFDPIYKALGDRDENKAGDVAQMLNKLEEIAVKTGAAIAFGAHFSKGNQSEKDSMDRIGGSGVFARDPDTILTMTQHKDEGSIVVECTLRNFPPKEAFVITWQWPLFITDENLNPEDLKQKGGPGRPKRNLEEILKALGDGPLAFGKWYDKVDKNLISPDIFKKAVAHLRDAAFVRKNDQGHWIKIARRFPASRN